MSLSRKTNELERLQQDTIQSPLPYEESRLAQNFVSTYLQVFKNLLDFSSLDEESLVHRLALKQNPINELFLKILSLATKNKNFLFKDELGSRAQHFCSSYYGASAKQYEIRSHDPYTMFLTPNPTSTRPEPPLFTPHSELACTERCKNSLDTINNKVSVLKIKGMKRSLCGTVVKNTDCDFERVIERHCQPRTVTQHSIRRRNRRLYVVRENRRILSRLNVKQYFHSRYSTRDFHFGFPLYMKSLLE